MQQGLFIYIFKHPDFAKCSNGGISETHDRALWIGGDAPAPQIFSGEDLPRIMIVRGFLQGTARAIPVDALGMPLTGGMMGGAYVGCSDSRFSEAVSRITGQTFYGLVPLHDRFE